MVAYVFDPINNTEGFFLWKEKLLSKANCFYVYSDFQTNKEKINIMSSDIEIEKKTKGSNLQGKIILIISIISLILSVVLLIKYFEVSKKYSDLGDINSRIKELKEEDLKTNGRIDRLMSALEMNSDSIRRNLSDILKYQVKPGDSLRKLAVQYYNDEGKYNFLIRYNNLKDENDIAVGQIIEIPLER
jgi:nucleoid-associated protein YgaU